MTPPRRTPSYQQLLTLGEAAGEVGLIAAGLEGLARASIADNDAYQTARLLGRAELAAQPPTTGRRHHPNRRQPAAPRHQPAPSSVSKATTPPPAKAPKPAWARVPSRP